MSPTRRESSPVRPSRLLLALFSFYLRWYVRRHFHALRLAHAARLPSTATPLIICLNHPSWWDPITSVLVSRHLLPNADHYAPMDAAALAQYGFMRRIGLFPVEQGTARGAAQFLRGAQQVLAQRGSILWMTPQGAFTDVRVRPLALKGGVAALVERLPRVIVLPVALEYTFWDERLPEILVNCGLPVELENVTAKDANSRIALAMEDAQQELALLSMARDGSRFETMLAGGAGVSGIYELWQRLRAQLTRQPYRAEHSSIERDARRNG